MLFFYLFQSDDKQDDTNCDNFIGTWNSWWGCVLEIFLMKQDFFISWIYLRTGAKQYVWISGAKLLNAGEWFNQNI